VTLHDKVQYQVIPVVGSNKDALQLDNASASPETPLMEVTGQSSDHISAYFNKGIIAAQWVSRALNNAPQKNQILQQVETPGNTLRNTLSGLLRPQILDLLETTRKNGGRIYAALYELNDPELINELQAFGGRCNLILGNGAFKSNTPPNNDENAKVRAQLEGKVALFNRIVKKGHFAHNKFVVFCDANGKPQRVLTGSTNWTYTGLCTQANNGLIIDDANVAADYLAAWNRIKDAENDYPPELVRDNSTAQTFQVDGCKVTPWFVKTSAQQDLQFARELINSAKEGILFLFFNPGVFEQDPQHWTLLQNILERHNESDPNYDPNLYFCGVVNQDIPQLTEVGGRNSRKRPSSTVMDPTLSTPSPVTLFRSGIEPPMRLSHDVMVPHNIKEQFHSWEQELLGAGIVNIHSKVIVIDPFGDNPVVITGSHNLGFKASSANDDNMIVIQGNNALAAAYAIHIVAIFQNYRWNNYVELHYKDPRVWHGLVDNDSWQQSYLSGSELQGLKFWMGQEEQAGAVAPRVGVAEAAAGGGAGHSVEAHHALAQGRPARHVRHAAARHPRAHQRKN